VTGRDRTGPAVAGPDAASPRMLVAGIGNMFRGDDGFGSAVAQSLQAAPLAADVEVADIGIRGVHLAYQLLDGYDTLLLVDAVQRGERPGTLTVLETSLAAHAAGSPDGEGQPELGAPVDPHAMGPDAVLRLLAGLAAPLGAAVRRVLVLGCEPADLDDGIGLSPAVAAAVPAAVATVLELLDTTRREAACTR
jgi:hydrogenase maturation protease